METMKSKILLMMIALPALVFVGCDKMHPDKSGSSPAIKLTVSGVETKAKVITDKVHHSSYSADMYDFIETTGFNISAYVTQAWHKELNDGTEIPAGLFVDPGYYDGVKPAGSKALKDIKVTYDSSRDNEPWRITGNDGANYADHRFSWVNNVPMNFFAYAPIASNTVGSVDYSIKGALDITKADTSVDAYYPFTYAAAVSSGVVNSSDCEDLIFAYASNTATFGDDPTKDDYGKLVSGSTDLISLTFHHALSQIRFCLSTDDGTFPSTLKLVSVKLKDITAKGSCTFNGVATTNAGRFSWVIDDTDKADYTQDFIDAQFGKTDSGTGEEIIPQNWEKSSYTENTQTYNLYICSGDVLFLLPQDPAGKELDITLQIGTADPFTVTAKLPAIDASDDTRIWEPGKYYTYKIKAFKTVTVELIANDWIDGGSEITI